MGAALGTGGTGVADQHAAGGFFGGRLAFLGFGVGVGGGFGAGAASKKSRFREWQQHGVHASEGVVVGDAQGGGGDGGRGGGSPQLHEREGARDFIYYFPEVGDQVKAFYTRYGPA